MILIIRFQTLVFCLASGVFLYVLGNDFQSHRRFVLRLIGLRTLPYYCAYYLFDYLFYITPSIIIIASANFS